MWVRVDQAAGPAEAERAAGWCGGSALRTACAQSQAAPPAASDTRTITKDARPVVPGEGEEEGPGEETDGAAVSVFT